MMLDETRSIETILTEKISKLERAIKYRETDKWQNKQAKGEHDTNGYFWNHCGMRESYTGGLEAMKILLREVLE